MSDFRRDCKLRQNGAVVPEAPLEQTEAGVRPASDGWFVLNARDAVWMDHELFGRAARFEGEEPFPETGIFVRVLAPGQPMAYYHAEDAQEDFLILRGECVLVIEGEERRLKAWDFVHCPPWTEHVLIGAGDEPAVVIAVGDRGREGIRYPKSELALGHRAGAEEDTTVPDEAYAKVGRLRTAPRRPYTEGDLPD
jgi:uncharacterized cupin superfamily protein